MYGYVYAMTFGAHIHVPLRMTYGDALTFL